MLTVPAVIPVTTPVVGVIPTEPPLVLQLQVPPEVASLKLVVWPTHTVVIPVMAAGGGSTVMRALTEQLPGVI